MTSIASEVLLRAWWKPAYVLVDRKISCDQLLTALLSILEYNDLDFRHFGNSQLNFILLRYVPCQLSRSVKAHRLLGVLNAT